MHKINNKTRAKRWISETDYEYKSWKKRRTIKKLFIGRSSLTACRYYVCELCEN